jgi:anti-sigma regulatory factor (Ser/Thr protein kinase)
VRASLADRPVGGLGVFLVRQMMDAVSYARVAGRNQLRMTKHLA